MVDWEYRAYDAEFNVCEGKEKAKNFPELAFKLRQRGLQILEAVKRDKNSTPAARRLAKMRERITPSDNEFQDFQVEIKTRSAIRRLFSWFIHPFLKRSNESAKPDQGR